MLEMILFNANEMVPDTPPKIHNEEPQIICVDNICMVDGSWTSMEQFSGCIWVCKHNLGQIQFMGKRNLSRRESALHSEKWRHYDGQWRVFFYIPRVRALGQIVKI